MECQTMLGAEEKSALLTQKKEGDEVRSSSVCFCSSPGPSTLCGPEKGSIILAGWISEENSRQGSLARVPWEKHATDLHLWLLLSWAYADDLPSFKTYILFSRLGNIQLTLLHPFSYLIMFQSGLSQFLRMSLGVHLILSHLVISPSFWWIIFLHSRPHS